jgi:hypothetical protein
MYDALYIAVILALVVALVISILRGRSYLKVVMAVHRMVCQTNGFKEADTKVADTVVWLFKQLNSHDGLLFDVLNSEGEK